MQPVAPAMGKGGDPAMGWPWKGWAEMAHSFVTLLNHVIFGTKHRKPQIVPEIRSDLFAYMGGIVRELGAKPILINGVVDHVHMLVGMPATVAVADFLRVVKANSSGWVHENRPGHADFTWQSGYGAFSLSQSNMKKLLQYIQRQEEHHTTVTFEEEYVALLKRHGIEYDQKYLWE